MKKFAFILMICILLLTTLISASESGVSYGDVPSTEVDAAVDAIKDDIYAKGLYMRLDRLLAPDGNDYGTRGDAWLILKDNYLCIFVDVQTTDLVEPDADLQQSSPWSVESVEVFINPGNTDDNANTIQYRIDTAGWPCVYTQTGQADYGPDMVGSQFDYAAAITAGGYAVEFKIPLTDYARGTKIGFQFQINDPNDEGQVHVMSPSSLTASSWTAELYDYITIGAALPVETEAPETEPPAETPAPVEAPAAQTGEPVLISVLSVAVAAAVLMLKKKKA
jgi:hypothetical protein